MDENLDKIKITVDPLSDHYKMKESGMRAVRIGNNVIIIGRPEHITVSKIIEALEALDPDIKEKYVEAVKRMDAQRLIAIEKDNESHEKLQAMIDQTSFDPEPFIIHNGMNIPFERYTYSDKKPHQDDRKVFKHTKPKRR